MFKVQINTQENGYVDYPTTYASEVEAQEVAKAFRVQAQIIGARNHIRVIRAVNPSSSSQSHHRKFIR